MKKFWLLMAVPMTILNGCQNQQAQVETTSGAVLEKDLADIKETVSGEGDGGGKEIKAESKGEPDSKPEEKPEINKKSEEETKSKEEIKLEAEKKLEEIIRLNSNSPLTTEVNLGTKIKAGTKTLREAEFTGSTVTIAKSQKARAVDITEPEIEDMVRIAAADLKSVVKNGQTVVLKPNLVQRVVDSTGELLDDEVNGITTDWRVTKAVLKMVRELNPDGKVYIMEGSATGPTRDVMEYYHYTHENMEGVDGFICLEEDCGAWRDFNAPEVVKVDLPDGLLHKTYYFNRILYESDVVISIPALKTSSGVVVTGGIKNISIGTPPGNLYGLAKDKPSKIKMVSHKITDGELDKWIYDYYQAKPVSFVVVDGLQGFQSGPVPMSQERKETDKMNMGIIMGGKDPVAVDTICSLMTGWDPESVGYLKLFRENTGSGEMEDIRVKGAFVDEVRKKFTLMKPELGGVALEDGNGPALMARAEKAGENLRVHYRTDENACKVEVFVDGSFQYSGQAGAEALIELKIPELTDENHDVLVVVYDRFLNKTTKTIQL